MINRLSVKVIVGYCQYFSSQYDYDYEFHSEPFMIEIVIKKMNKGAIYTMF